MKVKERIFLEGLAVGAVIAYNHNGADYIVAREILNAGGIDLKIFKN